MKQEPPPAQLTSLGAHRRLAEELQALRRKSGKSLRELELEVHVSDSSLSRYLSGRVVPPWQVVESLCRVAKHPVAELRFLWEETTRLDRVRTADAGSAITDADPQDSSIVEAPFAEEVARSAPSTRDGSRLHSRWVVVVVLAATAMLSASLGMWVGVQLASRPTEQQDEATPSLTQASPGSIQARGSWAVEMYDHAGNVVYKNMGTCATPAEYRRTYNLPREASNKAYSYLASSTCRLKLFEDSNGGAYGETLDHGARYDLSSRMTGQGSSIAVYSD